MAATGRPLGDSRALMGRFVGVRGAFARRLRALQSQVSIAMIFLSY